MPPRTITLGPVTLALPLRADPVGDGCAGYTYVDTADRSRVVARVSGEGRGALSHLFAASPDLLLAAEAVVKLTENHNHRGICNANNLTHLGGGGRSCPMATEFRALRTAIARARGREKA